MKFKTWQTIVIVVCIILLVLASCVYFKVIDVNSLKNLFNTTTASAITNPTPTPTPNPTKTPLINGILDKQMKTIEDPLVVDLDNPKDYFTNVKWEFLNYQMSDQDTDRLASAGFSDAVSFKFKSSEKTAMLAEVQEEILRSPVYCDMVIRGLKDIKISTNKTIGKLNPWMDEFETKMDKAMEIDTSKHPRGNERWLELGEKDQIFVTEEFRYYAVHAAVLLERLTNYGISTRKSSWNYCLPLTMPNSSRRTELADYQEEKSALVLGYLRKDGYLEFEIGFNTLDKRLEFFVDGGASPTRTAKPASPTKKPSSPTSTPIATPNPTKNPSADPVNQGNASQGGGKNQSSDGAGKAQATEPPRPASTNNSSASSPTKSQATNAPVAAATHQEESTYKDNSGNTVKVNDDTVFSGEIAMPA